MKLLPLQIFFTVLGILAPFFFPVPFVIVLSVALALFVPPLALLMGGLLDVLYFTGDHGTGVLGAVPYFTLLGLLIGVLAAFVQQFVKTRIMS